MYDIGTALPRPIAAWSSLANPVLSGQPFTALAPPSCALEGSGAKVVGKAGVGGVRR